MKALAQRLGFDPTAVLQVLDAREKKIDRGKVNVSDLARRYMTAVERVTAAVDTRARWKDSRTCIIFRSKREALWVRR